MITLIRQVRIVTWLLFYEAMEIYRDLRPARNTSNDEA